MTADGTAGAPTHGAGLAMAAGHATLMAQRALRQRDPVVTRRFSGGTPPALPGVTRACRPPPLDRLPPPTPGAETPETTKGTRLMRCVFPGVALVALLGVMLSGCGGAKDAGGER